jgi:hypothetical protein
MGGGEPVHSVLRPTLEDLQYCDFSCVHTFHWNCPCLASRPLDIVQHQPTMFVLATDVAFVRVFTGDV